MDKYKITGGKLSSHLLYFHLFLLIPTEVGAENKLLKSWLKNYASAESTMKAMEYYQKEYNKTLKEACERTQMAQLMEAEVKRLRLR